MKYRIKVTSVVSVNGFTWDGKIDKDGYYYTYLSCPPFMNINTAYREAADCNKRNNGCLYSVESFDESEKN